MSIHPIRVAVVGLGWAAQSIWLPRLRENPAFTVAAVVDPDPAGRAGAVHQAVGALPLSDAAALSSDMVDLAVVAVPNHLHAAIACSLLSRGIPVFLEKPVCLTVAEAETLADAEISGGAVLLAGSAARYRTDVQELFSLVDVLGPVRHIETSWVRARGIPDAGGWFTRRSLAGGGALVDLGWHLLDTVSPLLGNTRFEQVVGSVSDDFVADTSQGAAWRHDRPRSSGRGDVEDTARAFLVTRAGESVAIRASWASHEATDLTTIRVDCAGGVATLRCTFGFSTNRVPCPVLTWTRDGETTEVAVPYGSVGAEYQRQLEVLPAMLADPTARGRAVAEASRTIGVIERIYDSAPHLPLLPRSARPCPCGYDPARPLTLRGEPVTTQLISTELIDQPRPQDGSQRVRAVVFDLDGVIVDSMDVMRAAFSVAYAEVVGDGTPPFEEYNRHLGRYFPDIMRIMDLPLQMEAPFVRESYRLAHQVPLFPGVRELLNTLHERGIRMAVATGKAGPRARSLLEQLGVLDLFEHVIGSDEVDNPKPAPDIVLRALDLLDLCPGDAVMVGDAVTDITSARGAGVTAIAALWGEADEQVLLDARPDAVLLEPSDLLQICMAAG